MRLAEAEFAMSAAAYVAGDSLSGVLYFDSAHSDARRAFDLGVWIAVHVFQMRIEKAAFQLSVPVYTARRSIRRIEDAKSVYPAFALALDELSASLRGVAQAAVKAKPGFHKIDQDQRGDG